MAGPRFYLPRPLEAGTTVLLDAAVYAHAVQVLRLRRGAPLVLFNGSGGEYRAVLEKVEKKSALARIESFQADDRASNLQITLVQAISKNEAMEYALQKATELGVSEIVPVYSSRSVAARDINRTAKRSQRWLGIITSACEQCGRNRLPQLHSPMPFQQWLEHGAKTGLILDPKAAIKLASVGYKALSFAIAVGAEGGFSEQELVCAERAGLIRVKLGMRVLRTETASVAALAAIHALWGDFC